MVQSGLDADGHQQAMVIHFDCGGLGHDLLCTILKSNCDLDKCNVSMFFASTHLPDLKGFLSESKMVYVLLHLVNHGWGTLHQFLNASKSSSISRDYCLQARWFTYFCTWSIMQSCFSPKRLAVSNCCTFPNT